LSFREILSLAPLAVFVVWIGLRPGDFLTRMGPSLESARRPAAVAVERLQLAPVAAPNSNTAVEIAARAR
jgi:hypothetical protein